MRRFAGLILVAVLGVACGSNKVLVPPALDLKPYGRIAIVTFTVENAKGGLHELATERFAEAALRAQPGIEMLELGPQDTLLQRLGDQTAAAQELGKRRGVAAVFFGHLKITNPKASGSINDLMNPTLEATVRTDLSVRLLSTTTGATAWRSSAWATRKVGQVRVVNGQVDFMASDPAEAYGPMVDRIVELVTEDLWSTWQKAPK